MFGLKIEKRRKMQIIYNLCWVFGILNKYINLYADGSEFKKTEFLIALEVHNYINTKMLAVGPSTSEQSRMCGILGCEILE